MASLHRPREPASGHVALLPLRSGAVDPHLQPQVVSSRKSPAKTLRRADRRSRVAASPAASSVRQKIALGPKMRPVVVNTEVQIYPMPPPGRAGRGPGGADEDRRSPAFWLHQTPRPAARPASARKKRKARKPTARAKAKRSGEAAQAPPEADLPDLGPETAPEALSDGCVSPVRATTPTGLFSTPSPRRAASSPALVLQTPLSQTPPPGMHAWTAPARPSQARPATAGRLRGSRLPFTGADGPMSEEEDGAAVERRRCGSARAELRSSRSTSSLPDFPLPEDVGDVPERPPAADLVTNGYSMTDMERQAKLRPRHAGQVPYWRLTVQAKLRTEAASPSGRVEPPEASFSQAGGHLRRLQSGSPRKVHAAAGADDGVDLMELLKRFELTHLATPKPVKKGLRAQMQT